MSRRRRSWRAPLAALVTLGLAVTGVVVVLDRLDGAPVIAQRCTARLEGTDWNLSAEQSDNAALVVAATVRRSMPARAATIGIATALQESRLVNIDYGDRDSVGLFQQRPSQGWGTVEEIMDPVYATDAFYDVLAQVEGYEGLEITDAAQRVQRSGFPEAYAQHETRARAWASALTGHSPEAVTCTLRPAPSAGTAEGFLTRAARDFGSAPGDVADDGTVMLDAAALPGSGGDAARLGWSLAQWAVAVAAGEHVEEVTVADRTWTRDDGDWRAADGDALAAGQVRVTLSAG
jgi:hypothetical protein